MPRALPSYYTSLKLFSRLFETGVPCLTYHKLGPRPAGVRIKGLYVSTQLFKGQLDELSKAGFKSVGPSELSGSNGNPGKGIALTFDDGFANVLEHGLGPLDRHGFHAIQYLVANRLGGRNEWDLSAGEVPAVLMDETQIKEWLAAGHDVGSHTLTHPHLTRLKPRDAKEEIFASKKKLEDLFGRPVRHFCHPYGDWNPRIRDLVIEAGYKTACTTDFGINDVSVSPYELKRITSRSRSISFKSLVGWVVRAVSRPSSP